MVGLGRVELPTSPLSGVRSNQLSYRPKARVAQSWPAPALKRTPAALKKPHSISKRVSRTRLNVLGGYAARDHRAMVIKQRRLVSEFPRLAVRDDNCGLDDSSHSPLRSGPPSRKECKCHHFSFRKEVIQPQVLLRLPCYDFTPIMNYTLDGCPLAVGSPASSATHFRDVTGGVYKARERIHRGILIRDY